MARRFRSRSFVRPAPRTKIWLGAGIGETTLAAGATSLIGVLNATGLALRPFTILRTRLLISYMSDQDSVSERPFGSYGEIVVTDAATAVGVTAVPNPSSITGDPDADWYVYQPVRTIVANASSVGFDLGGDQQYTIDSKAMRKVGPNDDIAIVVDEESAVGSRIVVLGRQLVQLH